MPRNSRKFTEKSIIIKYASEQFFLFQLFSSVLFRVFRGKKNCFPFVIPVFAGFFVQKPNLPAIFVGSRKVALVVALIASVPAFQIHPKKCLNQPKKSLEDMKKCLEDMKKSLEDMKKSLEDMKKCLEDMKKCLEDMKKCLKHMKKSLNQLKKCLNHLKKRQRERHQRQATLNCPSTISRISTGSRRLRMASSNNFLKRFSKIDFRSILHRAWASGDTASPCPRRG